MEDGSYAITQEGLDALRAELHQLETTGRADVAARIKTAREWGDLKENGEYHAAKEDQAHLETRIKRLNERLRGATVVEAGSAPAGVVGFGSTVEVRDEQSGRVSTYTIVGAAEASAKDGRLSIESPVARALMGAREGSAVQVETPGGARTFHVVRVGA
jgi:transcription elongation factor GreA